jgi:hypothetical protein
MAAIDPARRLTAGETAIAQSVFGGAIDPHIVTIRRAKWWMWQPAWITMAPDGHIWCHPNGPVWCEDFSQRPLWARALFVHEMTHVWQRQSGINLVLRRPPLARYRYRIEPGKAFGAYGLEQQASIVEDAYRARERGEPDAALEAVLPF